MAPRRRPITLPAVIRPSPPRPPSRAHDQPPSRLARVPLVLGIDPGTRVLGYGVIEARPQPVQREFGVVRLRAADSLADRLAEIHRAVVDIIARHRPTVLAVEEVFHGKNFRSAMKIGEARGVVLAAGALAGLAVVEYTPARIKKSVTGNGRADKRQVQRMVTRLLGLSEPPEPFDASDALAIAFCHARSMLQGRLLAGIAGGSSGRLDRPRGTLQRRLDSLKNPPKSARPTSTKRRDTRTKRRSHAMGTIGTGNHPAREGVAVLRESTLAGIPLIGRGKVRDLYDLGEHLLVVTTDRISAFDVVLPDAIPDKGRVLTRLSVFWFDVLDVPHHLVESDVSKMPPRLAPFAETLRDRAILVRRLKIFPIECVVRGYLAGSGWSEYRERGSICGVALPKGLRESDQLPRPIFTPTTKAESGHDLPMTFDDVVKKVGGPRAEELRDRTIAVYEKAAVYARERGIIICDTKFEWGLPAGPMGNGPMGAGSMGDGPVGGGAPSSDPRKAPSVLADEVLTPDSSRFWPAAEYQPGRSQPSFDKQFVRDYLSGLKWNKQPPGPALPAEVIERTSTKYREIYERLTGHKWS